MIRTKKGIIASNKQEKTVIIEVFTYESHPKYKKRFRKTKKYHVDNPESKKFEIGDDVTIYESKPISKLKKWTLVKPNQPTEVK